jgi:hypothetical protein
MHRPPQAAPVIVWQEAIGNAPAAASGAGDCQKWSLALSALLTQSDNCSDRGSKL